MNNHPTDREPVGQAVNSILNALDDIACMALNPDTCDEVAEEEKTLGKILSRTQLILSFIIARQSRKTRLRIIK